MSLTLRALLLLMFVSVCGQAETRTLALYAGPVRDLDAAATATMRAEVQRLLTPAGIEIVWKNSEDRKAGEDFEMLAVGVFDGSCSAAPASTDTVSSLADTSVSNGRILPFFHVDCARVVRMLGAPAEPAAVGRALARVIAHELYHIVAQTADHHDTGVAKAVFSARDLVNPRFDIDPWSLSLMRPAAIARSSESSSIDTGR